MARVSLTEVWDQARPFIAKEMSLLAPVALLFFSVPALLWSIVQPESMEMTSLSQPAPWMIWPLPLFVIQTFGSLTLISLALVPGISVREAMRRAVARLPVALGVLAILVAAGVVIAVIGLGAGGGKAVATPAMNGPLALALLLLALALLVVSTRLAVLWPSVAAGDDGVIKTLQRALRLTEGQFWRLLGLLLLAGVVSKVLDLTSEYAGGSTLLLFGRLLHYDALGRSLALALNAIVAGLWQMVMVVYVAFLYRALAAARGV